MTRPKLNFCEICNNRPIHLDLIIQGSNWPYLICDDPECLTAAEARVADENLTIRSIDLAQPAYLTAEDAHAEAVA